jgi:hypothetical protein
VQYFETAKADPSLFKSTQAQVRSFLKNACPLALSERDLRAIERIHLVFYARGLSIKYDFIPVPTLGEFFVEKDLQGRMQNFLNDPEDFRYLKQIQEENRIIPIIGDFAGSHAFLELGRFLRGKNENVTVLYTSNVEQYLVRNMVWRDFIRNVNALPLDERAVFIREHWSNYMPHPDEVPGYKFTQILQWAKPFLRDVPPSTSVSFWDIVTTGTIKLK